MLDYGVISLECRYERACHSSTLSLSCHFWLNRCQGASLHQNFQDCVVDPVSCGEEQDEICHFENCCYSSHTSDAASSNKIPSNWQIVGRPSPAHVGHTLGFIKMTIFLISNSNMCVNQYRALIERATDCKCQD